MHRNPALLLIAGALSAGSVFIASALLRHVDGMQGRVAVAFIPVAAFVFFVFAEVRWLRSTDEFHRQVALESLAIAFPAAIALAVACEALQKAGVVTGVSVGDLWPYMALLWLPSLAFALLRYR